VRFAGRLGGGEGRNCEREETGRELCVVTSEAELRVVGIARW